MIPYKRLNEKKLKTIIKTSLIIGVISCIIAFYFSMESTHLLSENFYAAFISFLIGIMNTFFIMSIEYFIFDSKTIRSLPALLFLLIRISTYFLIGLIVYFIIGFISFPQNVLDKNIILSALISLIIFSSVINTGGFLLSFLGTDFVKTYFLSKYHKADTRETIFMFIDLANSTTLGEKTTPRVFFKCLNDFIFLCEEVIRFHEGLIYKYVGDCIIVVWEQNERNILKAYECVKEIRLQMNNNRPYFKNEYNFDLNYTIGVHSGEAAVGEIGFDRKEIGYLSDTVNTAQRIQSINKSLKTDCLFSNDFIQILTKRHPDIINIDNLKVFQKVPLKGKSKEIDLYTL